MTEFDAVVVAGGGGRRMGGVDKGALVVGGRPLLDRVLLATAGARETVVVGDARPAVRPVAWAREEPVGGGPLAAVAAGLAALPEGSAVTVVLATDLPDLDERAVRRLVEAVGEGEGAAFVDAGGRWQPLAAAYRTDALRRAVHALGPVGGRPVKLLLERLTVVAVPDDGAAADCDTPDQLALARARHERQD